MSRYGGIQGRRRQRTLLIVEGVHEKNILFRLIFRCFPEMKINGNDVVIYGTNIYKLYRDITAEYEENWYEEDVDLPYIVSKKKGYTEKLYKNDFTNIILVFDYERHDPEFSEEKILTMQEYFADSADMGKLYINYPMLESYQHFFGFTDTDYADRKVSAFINSGAVYKALVKESMVTKLVQIPTKIKEILSERFCLCNEEVCNNCVEKLLHISDQETMLYEIESILKGVLKKKEIYTAIYQMQSILQNAGYMQGGLDYYSFMRTLFVAITLHNIWKANLIQNGIYNPDEADVRECFIGLDLYKILIEQNRVSQNVTNGYIWVLNTCLFVIPDYNMGLLT